MNLHIHIGPANHQKILLNQLRKKAVSHSSTNYYPHFDYQVFATNKSERIRVNQYYDALDKVIGGLRSRVPLLRRTNWHMDLLFRTYDKAVSKIIKKPTLLFAWPMVSKRVIQNVNRTGGVSILDYPIAHISNWQKTLKEEAALIGPKIPRSLFTSSMHQYMLDEIQNATYINVPSKFVWNSFVENGVSEEKLFLNNYGIDGTMFYPSVEKDKKFTVVFVGSVEIRKGVHYLLQAFQKLKLKDAQVKIIGHIKEDFLHSFQGYLNQENIHWMGQCTPEETAETMRRSHVLVMPSVMEGLSLTILEAQASGLPVICSENTGGGDVIQDGYNGFVFQNRNVSALSEYLLKLYEDKTLLNHLAENSRKVFLNKFTADLYGERIIGLFEKITSISSGL